jgi:hypothetical protein
MAANPGPSAGKEPHLPSPRILYSGHHGNRSGTLRERGFIDGLMRIKAAHLVTNYPVFALTTKIEVAALTEWRYIAWLMSLGAFGSAVSIVAAGFAFGQ